MNNKRLPYLIICYLGIVLELAMLSIARALPNMYASAWLWILGGLLTVLGAIPLLVFEKETEVTSTPSMVSTTSMFKVLFIFVLGAALVPCFMHNTISPHPYNPLESDVIPTIKILVDRVLHLKWVYAPIDFPGWTVNNAYLPMQYLPFVAAELMGIDYRWLAYLSFIVILILWVKKVLVHESQVNEISIKLIAIFAGMIILHKYDWASFAFSLELIDVAFYLFLALSFFARDWRIKAIAILFCLLSRYAFVFWLPLYVVSYYIEHGKKEAFKIAGLVVLGVVVLYVLPFMTKQPTLFFDGLKYYDKTAIGQWEDIPSWYQEVGKPFTLTRGLSTSIYFYDFWNGDLLAKLSAARKVHTILCLLSVVFMGFLYWRWRKRSNFNYAGFLLLSLKFYFIFFYGFFYVPFAYLYFIPLFFSLAILFKVSFTKPLNV